MGTSNKWRIEYVAEYDAYEIHAVTGGEADRHNKTWDVRDESNSPGAIIHLWDSESKEGNKNTSQLWRFLDNGNGGVLIQNARSGKYLSITDYAARQESEGTVMELDVFADDNDPVNYAYSKNWMQNIPDDAYLSSVNIPGTHDSGTASILQDSVAQISLTSCQNYYYGEQLNVGVRSFDIRCKAESSDVSSPSDISIIHGGFPCYDRDGSRLTLDDILNDTTRFLSENPSEAVVMMIKTERGSDEGIAKSMGNFIKNHGGYVWQGDGIPSMGEARGKIVFLRRFAFGNYDPSTDGLEEKAFGLNLNNWDDYDYTDYKYAINIYDDGETGESVYVQDAYNKYSYGKKDYIEGTLRQTTGADPSNPIPADAWIYNYTSCATGFPLGLTRDINPWLYDDEGSYIDNKRLGMVMLNFVDHQMSSLIYETNENAEFFETKAKFPEQISITYGQNLSEAVLGECSEGGSWKSSEASIDYYIRRAGADDFTFPEKAVLTYGQTLSEAELVGASGGGEFVFISCDEETVENINDRMPEAGEYNFEIAYVPENTALEHAVAKQIQVTVNKKPVIAVAESKEKTYGEDTPALTYTFDKAQLVGEDTVGSLGLTLTAGAGDKGKCDAGKYEIVKKDSTSTNYEVDVIYGELKVDRKEIGIKWSGEKTYTYSGTPVSVTADAINMIEGDECKLTVRNGSRTNVGSYKAIITGISNKNYCLPKEAAELIFEYNIKKADPKVNFPIAELTYGQTLDEAELAKQSGDGYFEFKDPNEMPDISDSGKSYEMVFTPYDTQNYNTVTNTAIVQVKKKPLTITVDNTEKIYTQETPDFTWYLDESQLVGADSADEFDVSLTAGEGDKHDCDVGIYAIQVNEITKQNPNYEINVVEGSLKVDPLMAVIQWNPVNNIIVGGEGPSARILNLYGKNECTVTVEGDGTEEPSWTAGSTELKVFEAQISGLSGKDSYNYILPDEGLTINYLVRRNDANDFNLPKQAVMTYGEKLEDARMILASGDGTFTFVDDQLKDISDTVPESAGKYEYKIKFTPSDKNLKPEYGEIEVNVMAKSVTVEAVDSEKIYGEETKLSFVMDETQLEGSDKDEDLGLKLTAVNTQGEDQPDGDENNSPAGNYIIRMESCENKNYNVTVMPAYLRIDQKEVELEWSDVSEIYYTGEPAGVTAWAKGLLAGDQCDVRVLNGDQTEVGTYEAIAVSLSNDNYRLPSDWSKLVKEYTILEAENGDNPDEDHSGGDTQGGDNPGGDTSGGDTSGGDTSGGDTSGGDTQGGDHSGGDTQGGDGYSDGGTDDRNSGNTSDSDSANTVDTSDPTDFAAVEIALLSALSVIISVIWYRKTIRK